MDTDEKKASKRTPLWQYFVFVILVFVLTIIVLSFLGPYVGNVMTSQSNI